MALDWELACKPKGHQLDSQSGHKPGLQVRSAVEGLQEVTTHWCFSPSLPPSLTFSFKINKLNLRRKKYLKSKMLKAHTSKVKMINQMQFGQCLWASFTKNLAALNPRELTLPRGWHFCPTPAFLCVEVQNVTQNMPLWYTEYYEPKILEEQLMHKGQCWCYIYS